MADKELTVFEFDGNQLRTKMRGGEPWFIAADVCKILDIDTSTSVNGRFRRDEFGQEYRDGGLDEDEKDTDYVSTPGGIQEAILVSEPGLYSLVFKSRKPEAKRFKRWIAHEVLPQIRKTGSYSVEGNLITLTPAQMFLRAAQVMEAQERAIAELKTELQDVRAEVKEETSTLRHRVDSLDGTNIDGTPRQRLGKMINLYSRRNGINYNVGWGDFVKAYNTAFRTNLTARIQNFTRANGLKKEPTVPEYLEVMGEIEDALRVADKLLNQRRAG